MTTPVDTVTRDLLARALDAAVLRQQVFAANVASAGTSAGNAHAVSFESSLSRAREEWRTAGRVDAASLAEAAIEVEDLLDANGAPRLLQPDEQVTQIAANAVHHQVLLQGLSRHLGFLSLAVSDGRR
jgi:flagellar basal body rod protein FlgB